MLNILVNASTGKAQAELTALDSRLKKTAVTANGTSGMFGAGGKFSKGMVAGAAGFAALGAAAVVAGKELYKVGEELDDAYDKIRSGTGATGKQLEILKRDFRSVAKQVPDDFKTTGTAIADLNTRLGLTGKPLRQMSRDLLNLSRITETDLEGNIKSVARSFVDWEVPVKRQSRALNGLFRLSQRSGAAVGEIADNMQKFGSPLRTLGWEVDEAAAMFANFERAGVNMQTMVPGLKLAIGNLADPTDDLKTSLEALGVAAGNPEKGLRQVMELLGGGSSLKGIEKMNLAMDVFGKRAGADMAEAIKQGRFNLDSFIKTFRSGSDTIAKTTRDTNDSAENMAIFWNKVKIAVAPAAEAVQKAVSDLSLALSEIPLGRAMADVRKFFKTNQDLKDVLKVVGVALKVFGRVASEVWKVVKEEFRGMKMYLQGGFEVIRGIVRVVSRALRGDWQGAWDAVKEIVRGSVKIVLGVMRAMTAPVRAITAKIAGALKGVFSSAWNRVKGIFEAGADAVIGVVGKIIDVINLIPGVDIDFNVGDKGGWGGRGGSDWLGRQRGGPINIGKPSGDSVPTMLERGEYVLNRKAVKAVGKKQLDAVNFGAAPRFQVGGAVGMSVGGDAWDAAKGVAGAAVEGASNIPGPIGMAAKAVGKGPGWFIDRLPKPNLPDPFNALGPWLIERVTDWIKNKVPKASAAGGSWSGGSGVYPGVSGDTDFIPELGRALSQMSKAAGQSISVQSGWRSYAEQAALYAAYLNGTGNLAAAPGTSNHEDGRAADITPGSEVFGGMAGRFGMGFTVPGESWHIELLRRGGIAGMAKGGLVESPWFNERTKKGNINGIWPSADLTKDPNGWAALPTLPPYVFGALAEAAGRHFNIDVPGRAMMQMIMHEGGTPEGGKPGSRGTDPGGTVGYGPWAITTSYNDELVKRFGGSYAAMNNPVLNAAAMAHIVRDQGLGAWYGDQYVTDPNADWKGNYQLKNALGGVGYSAALRSALGGNPQPGRGDTGSSPQDQSKRRKAQREKQIKEMRKALSDPNMSGLARKGGLWRVVEAFTKWGDFGDGEGKTLLQKAQSISSITDPNRGAGRLSELVKWLDKRVGITGSEDENDSMVNKLARFRGKGDRRADLKRNRIFERIKDRGMDYPQKSRLFSNDKVLAAAEEWLNLAEQQASSEAGPGGSDLTDAEVDYQVRLNRSILASQQDRKGLLFGAMKHLKAVRNDLAEKVQLASKKGSPLAWKLGAFKKGLGAAKSAIADRRGDLETLIGVTGRGGAIFDTKLRLQNLGVASTVEKQSSEARLTSMNELMSQQLSLANRNNAILSAQLPVFQQFMPKYHTGGVVPGVGERPAMVMGGEGIFTRDQMQAMGGGSPTVVIEIAPGAGVDPNMIDARIDGRLVKAVRKVRTGGPAAGRSYVTNG